MDWIKACIDNPVKVTVGVILAVLFGVLALVSTPIQLIPNVDQPIVTVRTVWPGASPQEIEREVIDRQEEQLKGISNLREMRSTSSLGNAEVTLEFNVGVDRDAVLVEVQNKLAQVGSYPVQVEQPVVQASDAALDNPIAWLILRSLPGTEVPDLPEQRDYIFDNVKPMLERVRDVASVDVYGGLEREMQVRIDAYRLASRGIRVDQVVSALRAENINTTAGRLREGKREYVFRTVGEFTSEQQILDTVVASSPGGGPVYVRDLGEVVLGYKKPAGMVRNKGEEVMALPVRRQFGSNVMEVMADLKTQIAVVNETVLAPRGLFLEQVYDETIYITDSISMVTSGLWQGGILVFLVLLAFLRSMRSTLVAAVSLPTVAIASFVAMQASGRTLNVVSMAGIAFAIGMVVDASIVVIENIFRHLQMGKTRPVAALDGTHEVWSAIVASTLTNVIVFLPVLFVEEEAGQLFRDIAIAVTAANLLSMVVAMTVVPCMAARLVDAPRGWISVGDSAADVNSQAGGRVGVALGAMLSFCMRRWPVGLAVVLLTTALSLVGTILATPDQSYLPAGNRNLIFGVVLTPPGYSVDEYRQIGKQVESVLSAYWRPEYVEGYRKWKAESGSLETAEKYGLVKTETVIGPGAPFGGPRVPFVVPPIENFFFVSFQGGAFMGASSADPQIVRPLAGLMMMSVRVPGSFAFLGQSSLFGRGIASANAVDVQLSDTSMDRVRPVAMLVQNRLRAVFGQIQPTPRNFELGGPEVRLVPDRERMSEVGISSEQVATVAEAAVDGTFIGDYRTEGRAIDLVAIFANAPTMRTQDVPEVPLVLPSGGVTTLDSLIRQEPQPADQQILRIEEFPSVELKVQGPPGQATEATIRQVQELIDQMRAEGAIPKTMTVRLAGTADKFTEIRRALLGQWTGFNIDSIFSLLTSRMFLTLLVCYLVMAGLYESWLYPLVIMFSVPFGLVGGVLLLNLVYSSTVWSVAEPIQQLDMLAMLGFAILIGMVVNNAILVVYQSLTYIRSGLSTIEATVTATRTRLRPIFMTTLTTLFGLLPLVAPAVLGPTLGPLLPASLRSWVTGNAGAELYRGIGAVLLGGLFSSTVLTVLIVPIVFYFAFEAKRRVCGLLGWRMAELPDHTTARAAV